MVYLITSNTQKVGPGTSTSGLNDPTSYVNMLSQTFNIEKDSEIAVESLKITRNGNLQVSSANNQFGVFIGDDLAVTGTGNESTRLKNTIGWVTRTELTGGNITVSPQSLTDNIKAGLNKGLGQHPNFVSIDTDYPKVELKNASNEFTGFKYSFKQNLSGAKTHIPAVAGQKGWVAADVNQINAVITASGTHGVKITAPGDMDVLGACSVIGQAMPINQANGSVVFLFDNGVNGSGGDGFMCGLTRATLNTAQNQYINSNDSVPGWDDQFGDTTNFFDYFVQHNPVENKLEAYYTAYDRDADEYTVVPIVANETDMEDYIGIKFVVNGDYVDFILIEDGMEEDNWVSSNAGGANDTKAKTIGISNFYLYPKVVMMDSDQTAAKRCMLVFGYDGLNIPTFDYTSEVNISFQYGGLYSTGVPNDPVILGDKLSNVPTYQDFWATSQLNLPNYSDLGTGLRQETRPRLSAPRLTQPAFLGLNASGGVNKKIILIAAPSTLYNGGFGGYGGGWTKEFGAQNVLGYENLPPQVIDTYAGIGNGNLAVLESKTVPKMVSNKSLFVRLPDLPINSFNSGKGSVSKILYHMPRFDNSGNEVGGLYYQPHERLYIPFENTEAIRLNNLKVELCNIDETTGSVDLVGQTIICFDIRKRRQ